MGFDLSELAQKISDHGRVTRVVIAALRGSSPREVGAAMLVWDGGQSGTIGGGALEFEAAEAARAMHARHVLSQHALGPDLGQCCGGAVSLLSEVYDESNPVVPEGGIVARPAGGPEQMPLSVRRILSGARSQGLVVQPQLIDGWMVEPVHKPSRNIWIWGAGHVGRALVDVLAPVPDLAITWIDTGPERFPARVPAGVITVPAAKPAELVRHAPPEAEHLVVTYSHALDLELCHRLLGHGFGFAGLIGSATKWARFRSRLAGLGHRGEHIACITCPIGTPELGKHPQMIAVGVAADLLARVQQTQHKKDLSA